MQFRDRYHGKDEDREVGDDIEDAGGHVRGIGIITVTRAYQRIPDFLAWTAHDDLEDSCHKVEADIAPGENVNCNV